MEERINEILESIGLTKNERSIYLDLTKNKSSTALEISKRTFIHRTNTYDTLRKLQERGLISELIREDKRLFAAESPEKIVDYLKQLKQEVESLIPHIKNIKSQNVEEAISVSKGKFAMKEALLDLLKLNTPIKVYGIPHQAIEYFSLPFLRDFHRQRIKKKISMLHIYNENVRDRITQLNKLKHTAARHLSKEYNALASTLICGDTVLLTLFINPPSIIKIKNKVIADTYSKYFDLLWKQAKV